MACRNSRCISNRPLFELSQFFAFSRMIFWSQQALPQLVHSQQQVVRVALLLRLVPLGQHQAKQVVLL